MKRHEAYWYWQEQQVKHEWADSAEGNSADLGQSVVRFVQSPRKRTKHEEVWNSYTYDSSNLQFECAIQLFIFTL